MRIFAISDLHLSLDGQKPMDIYGGQWIGHTEKIKKNWKAIIEDEDVILLAGDSSWAMKHEDAIRDLSWIAELPGKKVLVKGNHDLWWTSVSKLNALFQNVYFLQNTYFKAGEFAICGSRGWICPGDSEFTEHDQKIYEREIGRLRLSLSAARNAGETKLIGMMHYPPANDAAEASGFTELFEEFDVTTVVYGHLHGTDPHLRGLQGWRNGIEYRLTSCDFLNCCPFLVTR